MVSKLRKLLRDESGITALETAIILIAFVVVASVFAFTILSAGTSSTEKSKAAIYAGFSVLARSVGLDLSDAEQVLIGGAFGQYINVEKAIQIGLLPDLPWERFQFLGNTSVRGSYMALLSREMRNTVAEVAGRMTYLELSADNTFYEEFTSALFLPHTEIENFPSVAAILRQDNTAEPSSSR